MEEDSWFILQTSAYDARVFLKAPRDIAEALLAADAAAQVHAVEAAAHAARRGRAGWGAEGGWRRVASCPDAMDSGLAVLEAGEEGGGEGEEQCLQERRSCRRVGWRRMAWRKTIYKQRKK